LLVLVAGRHGGIPFDTAAFAGKLLALLHSGPDIIIVIKAVRLHNILRLHITENRVRYSYLLRTYGPQRRFLIYDMVCGAPTEIFLV
jgi:hypothetical protein